MNELEALALALEIERDEAAKEAEHESVKRLFEELAEIEKSHHELLRAQYDSIMETGIWMDYQDFSLEVD